MVEWPAGETGRGGEVVSRRGEEQMEDGKGRGAACPSSHITCCGVRAGTVRKGVTRGTVRSDKPHGSSNEFCTVSMRPLQAARRGAGCRPAGEGKGRPDNKKQQQ